jgi:hypothetical protein
MTVTVSTGWTTGRSGFDSRQRRKDFSSSLCVQTGSGAHPASCTMGTGVLSPGLKRGRGVTLTTHLHLVSRSRMSRSYTSSPPSAFMACSGTTKKDMTVSYSINVSALFVWWNFDYKISTSAINCIGFVLPTRYLCQRTEQIYKESMTMLFWIVMPCRLVGGYQHCRETFVTFR